MWSGGKSVPPSATNVSELRAQVAETLRALNRTAEELAINHNAEAGKYRDAAAQLDGTWQKYWEQKLRADGQSAVAFEKRLRYLLTDYKNFLTRKDAHFSDKFAANWDYIIFAMIKALHRMSRAIAGTGGEPISPPTRSVPAYPEDLPNIGPVLEYEEAARNAQSAANQTAIEARNQGEQIRTGVADSDTAYRERLALNDKRKADARESMERINALASSTVRSGMAAAGGSPT